MYLNIKNFLPVGKNGLEWLRLGYGGCLGLLTVTYGVRTINLLRTGQSLNMRAWDVKTRLQDKLCCKDFECFSDHEVLGLRVLIEQFSKSAVVRPRDCFDLKLSTGVSLVGILLTYLIVLLQFRVGE